MARDVVHLERLVRELAELAPEDRARVVAEVARREHTRTTAFSAPTLKGGTAWIGDDVRREELYGNDGR